MVESIIRADKLFFTRRNDGLVKASKELDEIAFPHTRIKRDSDKDKSFLKPRPFEGTDSVKWRNDNYRQHCKSLFERFIWKSNRIFSEAIGTTTMSDRLTEWLDKKPFFVAGQRQSGEKFLSDPLYRQTLENPNHIIIALPYQERLGRWVNPAIFGDGSEETLPYPLLVNPEDLTFVGDDTFSFKYDFVSIGDDSKTAQRYLSCDSKYWWEHRPTFNKKGEIVYQTQVWYEHNTGTSMINFLAGNYNRSWDGKSEFYSSYIHHFFEIAESTKQAFSDDAVVRTRASYPIPVVRPTKCWNKGCIDGKVKNGESRGICGVCNGEGTVTVVSPTGVLIEGDKEATLLNPNAAKDNKDPMRWIYPDLNYPKHSFEVAWSLFDKAAKALYLDVLDGSGANTSGEALVERKQDVIDALTKIAYGLYETWNRFLWHCEAILVREEELRVTPKTQVPKELWIKTDQDHLNDVKDSYDEGILQAKIIYYTKKYSDNPIVAKKILSLLNYHPVFTTNEINLSSDGVEGDDSTDDSMILYKAPFWIEQMSQEDNFMELTQEQINEQLDDLIFNEDE